MNGIKDCWETDDKSIRLLLGDCLEILPGLERGSVDAVVTDPPYGIVNEFGKNTGNGTRTMQFEWDGAGVTEGVISALGMVFKIAKRKSGCFVFCGGDQFGEVLAKVREAGYTAKPAAWVKDCPPPAGKGNWWPSGFEFAVYGYKGGAFFGDTDPKRCNVFRCDSYRHGMPGKVEHPTQKPLKLIERIVSAIVPPEGVAIDCWAGSGTTGVACIRLGRRFIGIEKEPRYFEIAKRRIRDELDKTRLIEKPKKLVQRTILDT